MLTIDDAHWADDATMLAVDMLLQRASDLPLLVIGTRRPDDEAMAATLGERWQRDDVLAYRRIDLSPLDTAATTELAAGVVGHAPDAALAQLLADCDGNPLLVVEILDELLRRDAIDRDNGSLRSGRPSTSTSTSTRSGSIGATVLRRMAAVDAADRPVIEIAAMVGPRFTIDELAAVLDEVPAASIHETCRRAMRCGLLVEHGEDGPGFAFRHDLVRAAIEADIAPDARIAAHARIADSLRRSNAPASIVAEHQARSAPSIDSDGARQAVAALHGAALEVMAHDPGTASRLLGRALDRISDDAAALPVRGALVDALGWSGRPAEAAELAATILADPLPEHLELAVRAAFTRALIQLGRTTEAVTNAAEVRALVARDAVAAAWADAQRALCHLLALELAEALDAAAAVPAVGDGQALDATILARSVEALALTVVGSSADGVARARAAVAAADRSPESAGHRLHPNLFLGIALQSTGDRREAAACFRRSREIGALVGAEWAQPLHHLGMALTHWDAGRLDDLLAEVDAAIRSGDERGSVIGRVWAHAVAARAELHRHRIDQATRHLDAADRVLRSGGAQFGLDWLMLARAHQLAATGRPGDGVALLVGTIEAAASLGSNATLVLCGADLCAMAHADGDHATAARVAVELENYARRMPDDRVRAARALRARGINRGDVELLEQAADAFGVLGYAIEQGQAWLEGAERATRRRALPLARAAATRFVELDIPALAERAQATLAHHEPRPARTRSGPRATTGWEALTATEWLVVDEVCAGRSNGEAATNLGISRRTVEAHLRSIYTKLDIRSRVALVVAHGSRTS